MLINIAIKAFVVWLVILVLAIANGTLREAVFIPKLGHSLAFLLSGTLLSVVILLVTYVALPWFGQTTVARYVTIGIGWLVLTLVFEFVFGRLVQDLTWAQLLEAYTFKGGNIWSLVLLVTAVAPYISAKFRGWV